MVAWSTAHAWVLVLVIATLVVLVRAVSRRQKSDRTVLRIDRQ